MDVFEVIDTLTLYGADIAALSALTCVIVQALKRTLLKKCQKKVLTFVPFVAGTILYALFAALSNMDVSFVFENLPLIWERGFEIGALSTLVYVCYEQFIRREQQTGAAEGVIRTLIEGYVPAESVAAAAKSVAEAIERDVTGDGAKKAAEILNAAKAEGVGERDINLLARLIIETLARLNAGGTA